MLINHDPDGKPQLTDELRLDAKELGLHVVHVVCAEPDAKVSDEHGVSYFALAPSVPTIGDRIMLENGRTCEVRRVYWKTVSSHDSAGKVRSILLIPNVYAPAMDTQE
ncbi:MAG: hypothetical protein L6Q93_13555 [Phycisphaerae bacterium]|nr:hypothetical protein [Phycisphaerae bacterium]